MDNYPFDPFLSATFVYILSQELFPPKFSVLSIALDKKDYLVILGDIFACFDPSSGQT